jgi:hypothetical protein
VAVFELPRGVREVAVLRRVSGRRWEVRRITTRAVCSNVVPIDLISVWSLDHLGGRCFAEPAI